MPAAVSASRIGRELVVALVTGPVERSSHEELDDLVGQGRARFPAVSRRQRPREEHVETPRALARARRTRPCRPTRR